jgi:trimeric autotransporter adhesin
MTNLIQIINTICSGENSRRRQPLRPRSVLIAFAFALFALSPTVRAVDPPPGGGYPGDNTALGDNALFNLVIDTTTGIHNTATGYETLYSTTTGFNNTAIGWEAMTTNTTGVKNTAVGCDGLASNSTGNNNTAVGVLALFRNTTGNGNIALGLGAGQNITAGDNNIHIGNKGASGDSNTIRIGAPAAQANTFIAGIRGATVADGVTVVVGSDGHLGMVVSSERYKDAIQPMDKASEAILALKPVTFRYKHELDPNGIPQFGLTAEQVEKVNPDLVVRDDQGKPYTVRYEAVNAMLLNEFLKEHRKVETQEKKVQQLETTVTRLEAALKEQAAQIQKVNEKVELGKPAPRTVTND